MFIIRRAHFLTMVSCSGGSSVTVIGRFMDSSENPTFSMSVVIQEEDTFTIQQLTTVRKLSENKSSKSNKC